MSFIFYYVFKILKVENIQNFNLIGLLIFDVNFLINFRYARFQNILSALGFEVKH